MFGKGCKLASSQSNRHKYTDYYRTTDAHNVHTAQIFIFYAKSANSCVFLWTPAVKKTTKCLFLIFANTNANILFKYSHIRMRIFGPSLLHTQCPMCARLTPPETTS